MSILQQPPKATVTQLLGAVNLPTTDITDALLRYFWGYVAQEKMIGVVGLEPFAGVALLRSLAVDAAHRNSGIGSELVRHAERMAMQQNVHELYLLTNSAQEFFEDRGYTQVERRNAPEAIRHSREFAELCPASSMLMKKSLR